jgi:hypothetical protein
VQRVGNHHGIKTLIRVWQGGGVRDAERHIGGHWFAMKTQYTTTKKSTQNKPSAESDY